MRSPSGGSPSAQSKSKDCNVQCNEKSWCLSFTLLSLCDSPQELFIEEVRKNQRRGTITGGKVISTDIWLPQQGFREYYESGRFSDVTLECQGKEFEVSVCVC